MKHLWSIGKLTFHPKNETMYLKSDQTYILLNGLMKLRNHAGSIDNPNLCWLMYPGDYITFEIQQEVCQNPEIWVKAETEAYTLSIENRIFLKLLTISKNRETEIMVE